MTDVVELTNVDDFLEFICHDDAVVNFSRRNGCAPCRALEPHYKATAEKVAGTRFAKVVLDEVGSELLGMALDDLGIMSTPTLYRYQQGGFVGEVTSRSLPLLVKELS